MITAVSSFKANNISPSQNCSKADFNNNVSATKNCDKDSFQRQKAGQPSFGMNEGIKRWLILCAIAIVLGCIALA